MAKRASKQGGPKVGYFIQSRGPGGVVEFEEVYVYGPTRRSDEGIVGHKAICWYSGPGKCQMGTVAR